MDFQDYNAPVKYSAPTQAPGTKPRIPRALMITGIVIAVIALLFFGAIAAINAYLDKMMSAMSQDLPPAGVKVGRAHTWRTLERPRGLSMMGYYPGGLVAGDFDGDGDDELLKVAFRGPSTIYEVDGSKTRAEITGSEFMMNSIAWDCDRDGISEIVVPTSLASVTRDAGDSGDTFRGVQLEDSLPVFRTDGSLAAEMKVSSYMINAPLVGDITGDGAPELVVYESGTETRTGNGWLAFGRDGAQVDSTILQNLDRIEVAAGDTFTVLGDINGDGLADLVFPVDRMHGLAWADFTGRQYEIEGWPDGLPPEYAHDLNGDGCVELINAERGILDPATGTFSYFSYPNLGSNANTLGFKCSLGDFDGDGNDDILVSSMFGGSLIVFARDGTCLYHEEFGSMVFATKVLHAGGRDYIVVQLMTRLLISQ